MRDVILQAIALMATAVAFYNIGIIVQHSRSDEAAEEFGNEFLEKLVARCEAAGITDTELVRRNMQELNAEYADEMTRNHERK